MANPIRRFQNLYAKAQKTKQPEPTAMTLATADLHGRPAARTVLLKEVTDEGFVFFTNQESRKGKDLNANPQAALCFLWHPLDIQVLVEGSVKKVSIEAADAYWRTRPRISQIGAWASEQSRPLPSRTHLLKRVAHFTKKFLGQDVPRPPYWLGFCVVPDRIEFWHRGMFRLHRREVFIRSGNSWKSSFLYP